MTDWNATESAEDLTLTAEEVREFRRLRKEAADRAAADREARRVEEERRTPATHHVVIAGGEVVAMSDGTGKSRGDHVRRIVGAYEMSPQEVEEHNQRRLAALDAL